MQYELQSGIMSGERMSGERIVQRKRIYIYNIRK